MMLVFCRSIDLPRSSVVLSQNQQPNENKILCILKLYAMATLITDETIMSPPISDYFWLYSFYLLSD